MGIPWAVIRSRPEHVEPVTLAKALAAARHTPLQDQILTAKRSWGILAENFTEEEAQTLARALTDSGTPCTALPTEKLVKLPQAQALKKFDSELTAGLSLISAACLTATSTTTRSVQEGPSAGQKIASAAILLSTGLPINIGGKKRTVEKTHTTSDVVFCLDLIYGETSKRLRIEAEHFDYSFLKERRLYPVLANFRLLLANLNPSAAPDVATAPGAWCNWGARVLLESKPYAGMGYESLADLERESRWLLTLRALRPG